MSGVGFDFKGAQCGRVNCARSEYCVPVEDVCRSCEPICNEESHNFQPSRCKSDCKDYLYDKIYVRKDEFGVGNGNIKEDVERSQSLILTNQILIALIIISLLAWAGWRFWCYKKKKNISLSTIKDKIMFKKSDNNANKTDTIGRDFNNAPAGKPDLRLEMPSTNVANSENLNTPATMSTSISRRPAEDNTLDYAYDNPAMSTPSPNSRPHESSF